MHWWASLLSLEYLILHFGTALASWDLSKSQSPIEYIEIAFQTQIHGIKNSFRQC